MFERYTEAARKCIYYARFEASEFGSPYIETEHLLLGIFRNEPALAELLPGSAAVVDAIRADLEKATEGREKTPKLDLSLSHPSKRVLAYGAEEAERLNHKKIDV